VLGRGGRSLDDVVVSIFAYDLLASGNRDSERANVGRAVVSTSSVTVSHPCVAALMMISRMERRQRAFSGSTVPVHWVFAD
jgi:hypothetical protein